MVIGTKTLKLSLLFFAIFALGAGLYVVWLQTDKADVEAMSKLCYEKLTPHIDPAAFRGMDRFGEPQFALAMAAKWVDYRYADWVGPRGDIRQIVRYGLGFRTPDAFQCNVFDKAGNVIGMYRKGKHRETINIWERAGPDDAPVLIRITGRIIDGDLTLIRHYALSLGAEAGEIERVELFGDDAGKRWIEARYVYDNEARTLFLDSQLADRVTIGANGQRLSKDYRDCFRRDEPCEYAYETTRYEYDTNGNMIRKQYRDYGVDYDLRYAIKKNAHGDWISLRSDGEYKGAVSRAIYYWGDP